MIHRGGGVGPGLDRDWVVPPRGSGRNSTNHYGGVRPDGPAHGRGDRGYRRCPAPNPTAMGRRGPSGAPRWHRGVPGDDADVDVAGPRAGTVIHCSSTLSLSDRAAAWMSSEHLPGPVGSEARRGTAVWRWASAELPWAAGSRVYSFMGGAPLGRGNDRESVRPAAGFVRFRWEFPGTRSLVGKRTGLTRSSVPAGQRSLLELPAGADCRAW